MPPLLGSEEAALGSVLTAAGGAGGGGGPGTGDALVIAKFTGAVATSEGATHGYLADAGQAATQADGAEASPQLYPTGARTFSVMRVTATGGGGLVNYTVTLYKNGVATAQVVTVPAGSPAGTVVVDSSHPISFVANDKFDVRWDIASGDGSFLNLAVTLEGPATGGGGGGGGAGVASLNGETGALILESLGGTIAITTPDAHHINLEAVGGGGGGAAWTLGIAHRRFFAVDSTRPDDSGAGFSDVSMAAAGAVAKKTFAGLLAILPRQMNGRAFEIAINAGDYSAQDFNALFAGMVGADPLSVVRGTCTLASAGSVKFAGDINDVRQMGFTTATGMNAAGYNPTAATGTTLTLTKVGGGAPAFPAEPALPQGYRNRFDVATTTVGLRNTSRLNWKVTAGAIQFSDNVADNITTANTDVVYVEMPGVLVGAFNLVDIPGLTVLGIASSAGASATQSNISWTGCLDKSGGVTHHLYGAYGYVRSFVHPDFQGDAGMAFRFEGTLETNSCLAVSAFGLSTALDWIHTNPLYLESPGSTIGRDMFVRGGGQDASHKHEHDAIGNGGANNGLGPATRFLGLGGGNGLELDGTAGITVDGSVIDGAAQVFCSGTGSLTFGKFGLRGTTTKGAAFSLLLGEQWRVQVAEPSAMTATGATDDIELSAGADNAGAMRSAWTTWVVLNTVDVSAPRGYGALKDCSGNRIVGGPGAADGSGGTAEGIGEVIALQNINNPLARQWDVIEGIDSSFRVNPAQLASVPFATSHYVAITRAHALNDWVIGAARMLKAPLTFDAPPTANVCAYLSNTNAGQATTTIPTNGTQGKLRLGAVVQCINGTSHDAVDFNPELFQTVADGQR